MTSPSPAADQIPETAAVAHLSARTSHTIGWLGPHGWECRGDSTGACADNAIWPPLGEMSGDVADS